MYCANCGVKNVDESKFCTECGHRLLRAEAMPATVSEASHAPNSPLEGVARSAPTETAYTSADQDQREPPRRIESDGDEILNVLGIIVFFGWILVEFSLSNSWSPIVAALVKTFGKVGLIPFTVAFAFITLGLTFVTLLPLRLLLSAWRSGAKKS